MRLGDIATLEDSVENLDQGSWLGGRPAIVLAVQRQPGANTVDVVDAIKAKLPEVQAALPAGIAIHVTNDTSIAIRSAVGDVELSLGITIGLVILVIYLFLGRLRATAVPAVAVPLSPIATFGALASLSLMGFDLSIIALIGLLMLIGIVKKNAIMMIDVALQLEREGGGHSPEEAIREAARRRFRPIMMTTFCALLGAVPIAFGTGASSELRQPLGVAVVGGLFVSQILTLFITPVIFVGIERLKHRWTGHRRSHGSPKQAAG